MVTKEDAQRATLAQSEAKMLLEALQIAINDMRETFEEELKPYLEHVQKLEAEIANTDKALLDEILADIEAGNSTEADYPFVSFRHDLEIVYNKDKAEAFALKTGEYLRVVTEKKLDANALRKDAKSGNVDEVTAQEIDLAVSERLSAKFRDLF